MNAHVIPSWASPELQRLVANRLITQKRSDEADALTDFHIREFACVTPTDTLQWCAKDRITLEEYERLIEMKLASS